jgi:GntR family transcriptional regulator
LTENTVATIAPQPVIRNAALPAVVEHLKHSIATGAITAGEQLPSVRRMAEDLLINPNTVVRAYRDLESEGIVELRPGSGAFVCDSVSARTELMKKAEPIIRSAVDRLATLGLDEDDIRRLMENELSLRRSIRLARKRRA